LLASDTGCAVAPGIDHRAHPVAGIGQQFAITNRDGTLERPIRTPYVAMGMETIADRLSCNHLKPSHRMSTATSHQSRVLTTGDMYISIPGLRSSFEMSETVEQLGSVLDAVVVASVGTRRLPFAGLRDGAHGPGKTRIGRLVRRMKRANPSSGGFRQLLLRRREYQECASPKTEVKRLATCFALTV
jgi:hypothetical protein